MTEVATKSWYIVHTYSGFENKVKESLLQRV
jgi:transcription antitermination factor NusG